VAPQLPRAQVRLKRPPRVPVALTGTPGTGKSSVAAALRGRRTSLEVSEWALASHAGRRRGRGVAVDLARLPRRLPDVDLLVGHLAHLVPVRDVIVLRCHPIELLRRLRAARRGSDAERRANAEAEALDFVLWEALRPGRRVWEIDTSGRSVADVARAVDRAWRRRGPSRYGRTDWLRDSAVTEHLLDARP
jgi:adenylate kinase